jgi:hydantoinase/carbamoylase family amidase
MNGYTINLDRLKQRFEELKRLAPVPAGASGYSRIAFSPEEKAALDWLKTKLADRSLEVNQDRVGNVFGRWGGKGRALAVGSHLDTVPNGGLFDGALGVLAGLECIETLMDYGLQSAIPLELICFVGEEANPLGGTFGSRAVAGVIDCDEELEKKLASFGMTKEGVLSAAKSSEHYLHYLEIHIEQGAVLEQEGKLIGIVTNIAGIIRLHVRIFGKASHAGTTPMSLRQDALVRASSLIQNIHARATARQDGLVATVGEMHVRPNVASVVPGMVELTIEIRGPELDAMQRFEEDTRDWIREHMEAEVSLSILKQPKAMSPGLQQCIEEVCVHRSIPYRSMISGANHDANSMANLVPGGMIFVPSRDGISHHPDEYTSWEDIEIGANVLLQTILQVLHPHKQL